MGRTLRPLTVRVLAKLASGAALALSGVSPSFAGPPAGSTAPSGVLAQNAVPETANIDAANFRHWNAALAKMEVRGATNADAVINCIGDSKSVGLGAGANDVNGNPLVNARPASPCVQLVTFLQRSGWPNVRADNWFGLTNGISNQVAAFQQYDTRVVFPSCATQDATALAGATVSAAATCTSAMTFSFANYANACDLYAIGAPSYGSISISANGGAATTLSETGATGFRKIGTFSFTRAQNNVISEANTGSAKIGFTYMDCYDTTVPSIRIRVLAYSGTTSGYWAGVTAQLALIPAALWKWDLGTNDFNTGVTPATYTANMQALLALAPAQTSPGDNMLRITAPAQQSGTGSVAWATQLSIVNAERALAGTTIPYVDAFARFGTWEAASANALTFNQLHYDEAGYRLEAMWDARVLGGPAGIN